MGHSNRTCTPRVHRGPLQLLKTGHIEMSQESGHKASWIRKTRWNCCSLLNLTNTTALCNLMKKLLLCLTTMSVSCKVRIADFFREIDRGRTG